ncbi:MAG: RNA polymerase sigma factor [Ornithinimicrobium sp.]
MTHNAGSRAGERVGLRTASDAELWQIAAREDPEAFGVIFDRHADAVHRYCARRSGSADAADDIVSVVFLEAWRRRADVVLQQDTALPWLLGVARHTLSHLTRTKLRHRRALERLPRLSVPDHADEVVARLDDRNRLSDVERAFARLQGSDQDVIVLCVWQGLAYAEAAVALGVPIGTVRSRLSRARARLSVLAEPRGAADSPQPGSKDA